MKVYTIGNRHHAVRLTYEAPDKFTNPLRTSAGPVSPILVEAVEQVAAATGLEIFNSDFVFHEGLPWVVDVNPFPGLDSFPHASREVWRLIQRS